MLVETRIRSELIVVYLQTYGALPVLDTGRWGVGGGDGDTQRSRLQVIQLRKRDNSALVCE